MKPAPKLAGGSGDPPLRCFGRITAESDNGRGKPLPYGMVGKIFCGGDLAGGPPLRRFRHMTDKQHGGQPGKAASGKLKVDTHKAGECLLFSYLLK